MAWKTHVLGSSKQAYTCKQGIALRTTGLGSIVYFGIAYITENLDTNTLALSLLFV